MVVWAALCILVRDACFGRGEVHEEIMSDQGLILLSMVWCGEVFKRASQSHLLVQNCTRREPLKCRGIC